LPHHPYENPPALITFASFKAISDFLAPSDLLIDPSSHIGIHCNQVKDINPEIVYDLIGPSFR